MARTQCTKICPQCGQTFSRENTRTVYCSRMCVALARQRPGAQCVDPLGYRSFRRPDGRRGREHRWVMEQHLGRPLQANELVHHLDGNKLNNALENLALTTRADHAQHHGTKYFRDATHKECRVCRRVLPRDAFHLNHQAMQTNALDPHKTDCKTCASHLSSARYRLRRT